MNTNATTYNGAPAYEHSENLYLEFFSKAGSLFVNRTPYYPTSTSALSLFKDMWRADNKELCIKLLMWLRDIRGGAGNRSGSREIYTWLANNYPVWMSANMNMIPQLGRFDDLCSFYGTSCESSALKVWKDGLENPSTSGLAAKWAGRKDNVLHKYLKLDPKTFRKMLVAKTDVVESLMCNKQWGYVDYNKVPSVAMTRYNAAFMKNDDTRYKEWRVSLCMENSTSKVNTSALYPHDLVRMWNASNGEEDSLLDSMLQSMKNYIPENKRIMPICDFSGSMRGVGCGGSITAYDISLALGIYCSEKVGKNNPFYRKLIPFATTAKLADWKGRTVSDALSRIPDGFVGSTNIYTVFKCILDAAQFFNVSNDMMPNTLLILSDMQFNEAICDCKSTPVQAGIKLWEDAGYTAPKIVYWNLAPYDNQPATMYDKNVCLVSGFSPSILESVLSGDEISPMDILKKAVEKYQVNVPTEDTL